MQTSVTMARGGCRLQFQLMVQPQFGWPPTVIAKGPSVQFMGGSPIAAAWPDQPGYTKWLGAGFWSQAGYDCPTTLT